MSSPESAEQRALEAEVVTAQKLFSGKAGPVVQALYRAGRPLGFGDLLAAVNQASDIAVSEPTLTRQLLALEATGAVEAVTSRPPGQRRGVAVLYAVDRERVDSLIASYTRWIRGAES